MLAKGRKASGRGEAVVANYSFGPLENDFIIRHRLLTRTTTTRGEPPLKKLQKKFTSLFVELDKNDDNFADCDKARQSFPAGAQHVRDSAPQEQGRRACESPGEAQLRRAEGGD
ncbi:hypothetical protein ACFX13_034821 [Malus domestica]